MNLVLTGFMATGKSSVGKAVARRLGMRFVDMDEVIVERAGKSIARIFSEDGEERFRQIETELAQELAGKVGLVVATGGGCMLREANRAAFSASGIVICLWADPLNIWQRAGSDAVRPLMPTEGVAGIANLLAEREPAYRQLPFHIETSGLSIPKVVDAVLDTYQQAQGPGKRLTVTAPPPEINPK